LSNAADKSSRMTTDERDKPLVTQRESVTMSRAVSVERRFFERDRRIDG